jgi:hypothetical protein
MAKYDIVMAQHSNTMDVTADSTSLNGWSWSDADTNDLYTSQIVHDINRMTIMMIMGFMSFLLY